MFIETPKKHEKIEIGRNTIMPKEGINLLISPFSINDYEKTVKKIIIARLNKDDRIQTFILKLNENFELRKAEIFAHRSMRK